MQRTITFFKRNKIASIAVIVLLLLGLTGAVVLSLQTLDQRGRADESDLIVCDDTSLSESSVATDSATTTLTPSPTMFDPRGKTPDEIRAAADQYKNDLREESRKKREEVRAKADEIKANARARRDELKKELEERKKRIKELARVDARAAIEEIKAENIEQSLGGLRTENCIEQKTTESGEVKVEIVETLEEGEEKSENIVTLETDSAEKPIEVIGASEDEIASLVNAEVEASGYKLDNTLLLDNSDSSNITVNQQEAYEIPSGTRTVGIFLATNRINRDTLLNFFKTTVNSAVRQSSYNKVSINPTVFGPYEIRANCTDWGSTLSQAISRAGQKESNFHHVMVIADFDGVCGPWAGVAELAGNASAVDDSYAFGYVPVHELGHNFGAWHARFNGNEYGDGYSFMGKSQYRGQFNAVFREIAGWFSPSNITTVTRSGTYVLEPIETATSGLKAIKIPRSGASTIYVEYRRPIGDDAFIYQTDLASSNVFTGALIHTRSDRFSDLVDVTPPNNLWTPALQVGQSFTDSTGKTIRVTNRTDSALTVEITIPGTNPATPLPTRAPTKAATPTPDNRRFTISGTVQAERDGVRGARVTFYKKTDSGRYDLRCCSISTDSNGKFTLPNRTPGEYQATLTAPSGYRISGSATQNITLNNNVQLSFSLSSTGNKSTPTTRPNDPTPTRTSSSARPDLVVERFELTDASGRVKNTFKVGERIYVKVLLANRGNATGESRTGRTISAFYIDSPRTITQAGLSADPDDYYLRNGEFGTGFSKEYGSYPPHRNDGFFPNRKSWEMNTPGTYTARIFFDYDRGVVESDENNNQATVRYTIVR